jgi:LmbE family N-acetylglucosaminyl deacetylase
MKIFNSRKIKIHLFSLFAMLAIATVVFSLPTESKSVHQDPTVTAKQIEALPRTTSTAQSPDDRVALYQALLDLQNPWTVMCVAAHPDDEDGTSLIVMRRKFGAHTVSLFSTFGEGGQNAIGPELYEELGAIRARETMAAAEIQGSEPHFLGLKDFGFSKTRDEAFKFWGHEEGLRRMVLEIRKLRPDVIITNHSTTSNDHGQHQATALMVVEAFDAAADPSKFPEQLKEGVTTWQVQRLFVRMRGNAAANDSTSIVTVDPNEKDPVRDVVYAEEALRALQKHATQGPWPKTFAEYATRFRAFSGQSAPTGQLPVIRYALVREAKGSAPLAAKDSHNFLDGMSLPAEVARQLALPNLNGALELSNNRSQALDLVIKTFHQGHYEVTSTADPRREMMRGKIDRAAALAAGLQFQNQFSARTVVPNSTVTVPIRIANSGAGSVNIFDCGPSSETAQGPTAADERRVNHSRLAPANPIAAGAVITLPEKIQIPKTARINVPALDHLYEPTGLGINLDTRCSFEVSGTRLSIDLPLTVDVVPPVEISRVTPSPGFLTRERGKDQSLRVQLPFEVTLINHQAIPFNGHLQADDSTFGRPISEMAINLAAGEKRTAHFMVAGPVSGIRNNSIIFLIPDSRADTSQTTVEMLAPDAHLAPNLRVGYIRGFDFSLPNAFNALGVESKELSIEDVKTADLSKYTSVIVDNRVYESKPELIAVNQKLLDYANAGGTLIVFYHKSDEWNPNPQRSRPQLAPYKLILGNERVTDENAPITFTEPDHPLLNVPNKMGQEDFQGWIQERGLYYPREWDPQFHALLQSNDPGETSLKGGLLVADYGRGHYIYTSMVWYRELRAGIPGAYRMLANMISYGERQK